MREIAVRPFDHQHVTEIRAVAKEGVIILTAAITLDLGSVSIAHPRRPDQVQRHVRQCQILFQHRGVAAPFAEPVAKDQMVIADAQKQRQKITRRIVGEIGGEIVTAGHHIWPTSSGMS